MILPINDIAQIYLPPLGSPLRVSDAPSLSLSLARFPKCNGQLRAMRAVNHRKLSCFWSQSPRKCCSSLTAVPLSGREADEFITRTHEEEHS